ncbi:MAG: hypothetical protein HQK83_20730 [Fibrobacteria bacterium]|nr:hypothetical protein [Fibrobacteria bacterium]
MIYPDCHWLKKGSFFAHILCNVKSFALFILSQQSKRLAYTYVIVVITMVLYFDNYPVVLQHVGKIPMADKFGHFFVYGYFVFLVNRYIITSCWQFGTRTIPVGSLLMLFLLTFEECTQYFLVTRSFCMFDLATNYLAVLVFSLFAFRMKLTSL